jgi:hypothetical protein
MKKFSLLSVLSVLFVLFLLSTTSFAQTLNCEPPTPPPVICPEVNVKCECPVITNCPAVEAVCKCDCARAELSGLWEVSVKGHIYCGALVMIGSGFLINDEIIGIEKTKWIKAVETCE